MSSTDTLEKPPVDSKAININNIRVRKQSLPVYSSLEKRLLRLQNYFSPHSRFKIRAGASRKHPIRIRASKESKYALKRYLVKVYQPLLQQDAPDWVEPCILKLAKTYSNLEAREDFDEKEFFNSSSHFRALKELLEQLDLAREEEIKEAAKKLNKSALRGLWQSIRMQYFPERPDLDEYEVVWSTRKHTGTLASCNYERKRVLVASQMKHPEALPHLEPLLYHEMCHAYIGEPDEINGRRILHGKEFRELEKKHPKIPDLDLWIKAGGWEKVTNEKNSEY